MRSRDRIPGREEMKLRRRVSGFLKDNAAISRAVANSRFSTLQVALLRATSHEESPPEQKYVNAVLRWGSNSRLRVSQCVEELMERLNNTQNWAVALKSLMLLHTVLRGGAFIFQDRLAAAHPPNGGRNCLNMSNFRDRSSPDAWQLSSWVRAYAAYLDQWLATCRVLGAFLDGKSAARSADVASGVADGQLLREMAALGELLGALCECGPPPPAHHGTVAENPVVAESLRMAFADSCRLQEELLVRVEEVAHRTFRLSPSEAARFLAAVEGVSRREDVFCELMCNSLQVRLPAGPDCDHVTACLVRRLATAKRSLRAVGALQPAVSWRQQPESRIASKQLSVSARFASTDPAREPEISGIFRRLPSVI